jgi:hypothetical protein
MSKAHRGTGIRSLPAHGRGTCPVTKRTGVKVVYEQEIDGQKLKISKIAFATLKNKARKEAKLAKPAQAEVTSAEATEAPAETAPASDAQ